MSDDSVQRPPQKVALVTGGSRGIAAAVAKRLAADGLAVLVNYRADRVAAGEIVGAITGGGGRALAVRADVGDTNQMVGLFDAAVEHFGRLDVVVSNAGIGHSVPLAEATSTASLARFGRLRHGRCGLRDHVRGQRARHVRGAPGGGTPSA